MNSPILAISERGQITIPIEIRGEFQVKYFVCQIKKAGIMLTPLQTKEDFLTEMDTAEKHWEKHGGKTLKEVKKKYRL